jgi:peptide/nickel transport system permease protein
VTSVTPETEVGLPGAVSEAEAVAGRSPRQLFWARFKKDRAALFGLGLVILLVVIALTAPLVAEYVVEHGPNQLFTREMTDEFGLPKGPNSDFWFGGDNAGRDVFVRVLYGARTSLMVALVATGAAVAVGVALGITAGYFGGVVDTVISRTIDVILSMPYLLFAIGIVAACGATVEGCLGGLIKPGRPLVIFVIAIFTWPYIARIVRGNTLSLREKEFIEASRSVGAGNMRIMFSEVLPNLVAPILVYATYLIPNNILFEAALSFLGLGVPQHIPSWGRILADAAEIFEVAWWLMLFPGVFLITTTLAFNLLGDGLRDALDPRTER